jgi:hypothetical protein
MRYYNFQLALIFAFFMMSCSDYDRENFRMEVGKRYDLKKWPDSAYIDTLDRFFKNEQVKQPQKQKTEITMSMNNSVMNLPEKKTNAPKKQTINENETLSKKSESENSKNSGSFLDGFVHALNKLSENPNSKEFGKRYRAKNGENLDDLLLRIYGSQAKKIPKFISETMIKQLNSDVDFSALSEKDMVLLPLAK